MRGRPTCTDWPEIDAIISRLWYMFDNDTIAEVTGLHKTQLYRRVAVLRLPLRESKEFRSARLRLAREVGRASQPNSAAMVAASVPSVSPQTGGATPNEPGAAFLGRAA